MFGLLLLFLVSIAAAFAGPFGLAGAILFGVICFAICQAFGET